MRPERKPYHRSFWVWSAYSPLQSWRLIIDEWIAAAKDPSKQRVFLNDTAGLAYKAAGEAPPWEALRDRAEHSATRRGIIPAGFVLLTLGLDVQKDRVEWQLVAWSRDGRRAVVDIGLVPGAIDEKGTQVLLDGLMAQSLAERCRPPHRAGHGGDRRQCLDRGCLGLGQEAPGFETDHGSRPGRGQCSFVCAGEEGAAPDDRQGAALFEPLL